jgi:predicted MPP superfamily phosphohydrolase
MQIVVEFIGVLFKLAFAAVVVVIVVVGWSIAFEPGLLSVTSTQIATTGWQSYWKPLKIVVLSDLHVGSPHIDVKQLELIVDTVNAQEPDVVLLLGDYMTDGYYQPVSPEVFGPILGRLTQAPHGVFAILGEHDWRTGDTSVADALKREHITVLRNQAAAVKMAKGRRFWIVGLADPASGTRPDYARAIKSVPRGEPVFVMIHNPVWISQVSPSAVASFAGHTHGGLFNIPYANDVKLVPADTDARYARGLMNVDGKTLFVSSGIGSGSIPIRVNLTPEIAVVTVRSAG